MKKSLFRLTIFFAASGLGLEARAQNAFLKNLAAADSTKRREQARTLEISLLPRLPFRGAPEDYYGLFSGTVVQDYRGEARLHHRGGRHDEIDYAIDGANIRSAYTGLPLLRFIPEALQRLSLETAPGVSQSAAGALLRHELRRGGADYKFSVRGETDRFTSDYQRRLGTYSYGYANTALTAEGKILNENMRFFAAAEFERFGDHYRKFWEGFRFSRAAVDPSSQKTMRELLGVDEIIVQPGNIPAESRRYTVNSLLTGEWSRWQWRAVGLFNREQEQRNEAPIRNLFNLQRLPEAQKTAGLLSLQADHAITASFKFHAQADFLRSQNKTYDPLLKDEFWLYNDSTANVAAGVAWRNGFTGPGHVNYLAFPFSRPGEVRASYAKAEENSRSFSGNLQKHFGALELKLGAAWQRRTLRNLVVGNTYGFAVNGQTSPSPAKPFSQSDLIFLRLQSRIQNYGYDLFGKPIAQADEVNDGPARPSNFSVYLEENWRARNVIITAGLRYEALASDGRVFINPADPALQNYFPHLPLRTMKRAPTHRYVTPRFSAAFPANERLTLKFDFGKYVQAPQLRDVYASRQERVEFLSNYTNNYSPRALDAEAIRSTQAAAEIIFQPHAFVRVQTALFHKQISGQLHAQKITTVLEPDREVYYLVLGNDGEAKTQGVETSLNWNRKNWQAWLNYTFASARGLTSYPHENLRSLYVSGQFTTPQQFTPLEFNQKHRGKFLLSYQFDRGAPALLRQTGVYALTQFNSGHNYTLYDPGDAFG